MRKQDEEDLERIKPAFLEAIRTARAAGALEAFRAVLSLLINERERYTLRARLAGSREAEAVANVLTHLAERVQALAVPGPEGGER